MDDSLEQMIIFDLGNRAFIHSISVPGQITNGEWDNAAFKISLPVCYIEITHRLQNRSFKLDTANSSRYQQRLSISVNQINGEFTECVAGHRSRSDSLDMTFIGPVTMTRAIAFDRPDRFFSRRIRNQEPCHFRLE
jgi:hypothetical protein